MLESVRQSPIALIGLICLLSAPPLLIASKLAIDPPQAFGNLSQLRGAVTNAEYIGHYKEAGTSFELTIKGSDGAPRPLDVVKQYVTRDDMRALVGKDVEVLHDGELIYELKSGGRKYFGYEDVANMVRFEMQLLRDVGIICGIAGVALLGWWHFRRRAQG